MSKNFIEMIEEYFFNTDNEKIKELNQMIKEAQKENVELSVTNTKKDGINVSMKGTGIAILVAMAGLEQAVLNDIKCPEFVWEHIKSKIGVEKA